MNSRKNYSTCQWDASWRGSTGTTDRYTSETLLLLRHPWVPFSIIQADFRNAPCSRSSQSTFIHLQFVSPSFHSTHNSEKEKPLLRVVAAVTATTSGFASDGMNRLQSLLPGVGMNGRRVQSYEDTTKTSPWNSSMQSLLELELGCYNGCLNCSSFKYYSWVQQEYVVCLERL